MQQNAAECSDTQQHYGGTGNHVVCSPHICIIANTQQHYLGKDSPSQIMLQPNPPPRPCWYIIYFFISYPFACSDASHFLAAAYRSATLSQATTFQIAAT
jgi:hypothetical protein